MNDEVSKSELAKAIGKSGATITKLVKEGVLDNCFTPGGKIYLKKALDAITKRKGSFFISQADAAQEKKLHEMTQLEIMELVEKEKNIKFTRPNKSNDIMSIEKLKGGSMYLWTPQVITLIDEIKEHLKSSFTDDDIEAAIKEIDNESRSNFMYELLDEIMRDKSETVQIHFLYKKMLSAFYSSSEIAFFMECMKED